MKKNERLDALKILLKLLQQKKPLSQLLQLQPELSALSKEICFGVCRHYFRLEALAKLLIEKEPKSLEVWLSILIGLYQLYFLNKPNYAVVKETVDLLDHLKKPWAKGLVNAVLRRFCREKKELITALQSNLNFIDGHPAWFVEQMKLEWPEHWKTLLETNDKHPPMSLRVNQQQVSQEDYLARLQQEKITAFPLPYSSVGIQLESPCEVDDLPGFYKGEISVQDESAQLAVPLLDLKPGLRVLDACCAPGGKTGHIVEAEPFLEKCVALDISKKRLVRVKENLNRLELSKAVTLIEGDASLPDTWWNGELFDRILLDAPCSATGIMRRHPDLKLLRTKQEVENAVKLQEKLLFTLWPLLKPGGRLVYATCSVMQAENSQQICQFIKKVKDCYLLSIDQEWGKDTGTGRQILPQTERGGDGFFYSVLMKVE